MCRLGATFGQNAGILGKRRTKWRSGKPRPGRRNRANGRVRTAKVTTGSLREGCKQDYCTGAVASGGGSANGVVWWCTISHRP